MMKKLIFQTIFLLLLNLTIVHSHFHSMKEFETHLIKCCRFGRDKAPAYQTYNQISLMKINSKEDICRLNHTELLEVPKELKPQCLSIMKLCCTRELNKHTCRFSKSLVKHRLDHTNFSLNKHQTSKPNFVQNDSYYQQCLPNSQILSENLLVTNSTSLNDKLFTKIVLFAGTQTVFSECCVACKLGLFSALNDYKCIIEKSIKSSKLFEESFYECCYKLKRELNLSSSGKTVDISSLELLIYPELGQIIPKNPSSTELLEKPKGITDLLPSQSLTDSELKFLDRRLGKNEPMYDIRTQFIAPEFYPPPKLVQFIETSVNCSKGMRLDEKKQNCVDDNCEMNSNRCKNDEKCINTKPGYKCIPTKIEFTSKVGLKNSVNKPVVIPILNKSNSPNKDQSNLSNLPSKDNKSKQGIEQSQNLNRDSNYFEPYKSQQNYNRLIHSNQNKQTSNTQPNNFNLAYPKSDLYNPSPVNYPNQWSNAIPNRNVPSNLNKIRNNQISLNKIQRRKPIDKCKIGNHNCDQKTQKCRPKENDFVCIDNQNLEEYDKLHPYVDDYQSSTILPDIRKTNCPIGYQFNSDTNQCQDINECETGLHNCTTNFRCDNKIGSFTCVREISCGTGYTFNQDSRLCEDIDECQLNLHGCKEPYKCVNYYGTSRCELIKCEEGYRLLNDRCVQVVCALGFKFNKLNEKCVDQDECVIGVDPAEVIHLNRSEQNEKIDLSKLEKLPNGRYKACDKNEKCINLSGGFVCQNLFDKQHSNDLINEQSTDFSSRFTNNKKRLEIITNNVDCKVIPNANYTNLKSIDRSRTKICNYKCVKTNDDYICECPKGFHLKRDGSKCSPIDQCKLLPSPCKSNEFCFNMRGSFRCVDIKCPTGYVKNSRNQLQCINQDRSTVNVVKPRYISYSFLSIQSNIDLTNEEHIRIASIRGATTSEVDYQLLSVNSTENLDQSNLAKKEDFHLKRADIDDIYLKRSLIGPQEIQLEFSYKTNQNGLKIIMNQLLITIYVSKYSF